MIQSLTSLFQIYDSHQLYIELIDVPAGDDDIESVSWDPFSQLDTLSQLACKHRFKPETISGLVSPETVLGAVNIPRCPMCRTFIDERSIKHLESIKSIFNSENIEEFHKITLYDEESGKEHVEDVKIIKECDSNGKKKIFKRFVWIKSQQDLKPIPKCIMTSFVFKIFVTPFNCLHWGSYALLRLATKIGVISNSIFAGIGVAVIFLTAFVISPLVVPFSINCDPAYGGFLNFRRVIQNSCLVAMMILIVPLLCGVGLHLVTHKLDKVVIQLKPQHTPKSIWQNSLSVGQIQ